MKWPSKTSLTGGRFSRIASSSDRTAAFEDGGLQKIPQSRVPEVSFKFNISSSIEEWEVWMVKGTSSRI